MGLGWDRARSGEVVEGSLASGGNLGPAAILRV